MKSEYSNSLSLFAQSPLSSGRLASLPVHDKRDAGGAVTRKIAGTLRRFSQPLTFTPFASAQPCSARCVFCSETLVYQGASVLSAALRPGPSYFDQLEKTLEILGDLEFGLSLSGLEATDDADWLLSVLRVVGSHDRRHQSITDRVLYSNGNGLTDERLLDGLAGIQLTRVELSRHHHEAAKNLAIMRFRPGVGVASQPGVEDAIEGAGRIFPVRLVCVLQKGGIEDVASMLDYLRWAEAMGIRDVVFREFSRLGNLYRENRTQQIIESRRVAVEPLISALLEQGEIGPTHVESGYYYWNLRATWRGLSITIETSDYREMKTQHEGELIHKLVFHANGNLCADWDPNRQVIWRAARQYALRVVVA